MIISKMDNNHIFLSWRNGREKQFKTVEHRPYFFVKEDSSEPQQYKISKYLTGDFTYESGPWTNLAGQPLKKVYIESANDMRKARDGFVDSVSAGKYSAMHGGFSFGQRKLVMDKIRKDVVTYESDVPAHFRYAVDCLEEIPEYDMRKWYWDMEWQQGGEYDQAITTIVMYDNYDETFYQFTWYPEGHSDRPEACTIESHPTEQFFFDSEAEMIEGFITMMVDKDPDMLIAWFGLKFDLPKLLERCAVLNVDPFRMSPIGLIKGVHRTKTGTKFRYAEKGFTPIQQPIGGRITLNLDLAFERQWNDAQRGTLPSLALEYVSQTLFGEGKHADTKFEDPNEFYRRAWLEDKAAYLQYALMDVELIRRIDEENFTSEAILALQRLIVAPFDACFYASNMGSIYFMRNASWKAPTGIKPKWKDCDSCGFRNDLERKECKECKASLSYKGAMVYDPLSEGTNGLHLGVAAFDFAGLYPSMMVARNISWETKSASSTPFAVNLDTPKDFSEVTTQNMRFYKTDELGLLPTAVLELKELRNDYKAKMKLARDSNDKEELIKWNNNQMAVKRLMASFYGIIAFEGFGWADVDLAASITASAREAIRAAAFKAKEMNI